MSLWRASARKLYQWLNSMLRIARILRHQVIFGVIRDYWSDTPLAYFGLVPSRRPCLLLQNAVVLEAQHFFFISPFDHIVLALLGASSHPKKGFWRWGWIFAVFCIAFFSTSNTKMVTCRNKLNMDWLLLISIDILSKEKFFAEVFTLCQRGLLRGLKILCVSEGCWEA